MYAETLSLPMEQEQHQPTGQSREEMSVEEMLAAMHGEDEELQFQAMSLARRMLSQKSDPPIDLLIGHGIVAICIRFMQKTTNDLLQFEAVRALSIIASGSSEQKRCVITHNAVPHFMALLKSRSLLLACHAVWGLANIASNGAAACEMLLQYKIIDGILPLINGKTPSTQQRNIVWLMSNLCRNKGPRLTFKQVKRLLPVLSRMLLCQDTEVLSEASWALVYVTDDADHSKIQAVVNLNAVPRLMNLLLMDEMDIVEPALLCLGNIVSETNVSEGLAPLEMGGLEKLELLQNHSNKLISQKASAIREMYFNSARDELEDNPTQPNPPKGGYKF